MIRSASAAPADGVVTLIASTGEPCTDAPATVVNGNAVSHSCSNVFKAQGDSQVHAEFTDSNMYRFSRFGVVTHTT